MTSNTNKEKRDCALREFLDQVRYQRSQNQENKPIEQHTSSPSRSLKSGGRGKQRIAHKESPGKSQQLLQKHLHQYNELMHQQPRRHTEQQLSQERRRLQEAEKLKNQEELRTLRMKKQAGYDGNSTCSQPLQTRSDNQAVPLARVKPHRKEEASGLSSADDVPGGAPVNVWQMRKAALEELTPSSVLEEEEMLRRALAISMQEAHSRVTEESPCIHVASGYACNCHRNKPKDGHPQLKDSDSPSAPDRQGNTAFETEEESHTRSASPVRGLKPNDWQPPPANMSVEPSRHHNGNTWPKSTDHNVLGDEAHSSIQSEDRDLNLHAGEAKLLEQNANPAEAVDYSIQNHDHLADIWKSPVHEVGVDDTMSQNADGQKTPHTAVPQTGPVTPNSHSAEADYVAWPSSSPLSEIWAPAIPISPPESQSTDPARPVPHFEGISSCGHDDLMVLPQSTVIEEPESQECAADTVAEGGHGQPVLAAGPQDHQLASQPAVPGHMHPGPPPGQELHSQPEIRFEGNASMDQKAPSPPGGEFTKSIVAESHHDQNLHSPGFGGENQQPNLPPGAFIQVPVPQMFPEQSHSRSEPWEADSARDHTEEKTQHLLDSQWRDIRTESSQLDISENAAQPSNVPKESVCQADTAPLGDPGIIHVQFTQAETDTGLQQATVTTPHNVQSNPQPSDSTSLAQLDVLEGACAKKTPAVDDDEDDVDQEVASDPSQDGEADRAAPVACSSPVNTIDEGQMAIPAMVPPSFIYPQLYPGGFALPAVPAQCYPGAMAYPMLPMGFPVPMHMPFYGLTTPGMPMPVHLVPGPSGYPYVPLPQSDMNVLSEASGLGEELAAQPEDVSASKTAASERNVCELTIDENNNESELAERLDELDLEGRRQKLAAGHLSEGTGPADQPGMDTSNEPPVVTVPEMNPELHDNNRRVAENVATTGRGNDLSQAANLPQIHTPGQKDVQNAIDTSQKMDIMARSSRVHEKGEGDVSSPSPPKRSKYGPRSIRRLAKRNLSLTTENTAVSNHPSQESETFSSDPNKPPEIDECGEQRSTMCDAKESTADLQSSEDTKTSRQTANLPVITETWEDPGTAANSKGGALEIMAEDDKPQGRRKMKRVSFGGTEVKSLPATPEPSPGAWGDHGGLRQQQDVMATTPRAETGGTRPCKYGAKCRFGARCPFSHPGRDTIKTTIFTPTSASRTRDGYSGTKSASKPASAERQKKSRFQNRLY